MEFLPVIIAVVIIVAIIITIAVVKSKKSKKNEPEKTATYEPENLLVPSDKKTEISPVTFNEDVEVSFEGISLDYADDLTEHAMNSASTVAIKPEVSTIKATTAPKPVKPQITTKEHLEATTIITTEPTESAENVIEIITSFFNGKYYFDGEMIANGEKTPLELAMNGSDFHLFSEMDGKDISIMNLDSRIYMLNPDAKKYAELTASFQKMTGIDTSKFYLEFNKANFDGKNPVSVTKARYNGLDAACYTYKNELNHVEVIAVGNEIKQLALFEHNGSAHTVLVADEFTAEIPEEMLNFKGYSKTNMISFITSLM